MRFLLLGVDEAVSMRVQSDTNMNNSASWEKAYEKLHGRLFGRLSIEPSHYAGDVRAVVQYLGAVQCTDARQ